MVSNNPASGERYWLTLVLCVLAAAVVAVVGLGGWLLLAPDYDDLEIDGDRTPDETVHAFVALSDDRLCEAFVMFWTERWWTDLADSRAEAIDVCEHQSEADASGGDNGGYFIRT